MPFALESKPRKYSIPPEYNYDYKIYSLSKLYGISTKEAGQMKESDYWKSIAFNNSDVMNVQP